MAVVAGSNIPIPRDTICIFTGSGSFVPQFSGTVEVLVVAGGGGGGMDIGGGGGGGGVLTSTAYSVTAGAAITVTVGVGGNGAPAGSTSGQPGGHQFTISATNGGNSVFGSLTAIGGGRGGSSYWSYTPDYGLGGAGGSGGGASGYSNGTSGSGGGAGTAGQGNRGGNVGGQYYSGGGGGAGGPGADGTNRANGGIGVYNSILGTGYYWAGGGGGANHSLADGSNGGLGGGGGGTAYSGIAGLGGAGYNNGSNSAVPAANGTPGGNGGTNTGGGGGGGSHYNTNNKGGDGGSGIVVVRFPSSLGTAIATNGNIVIKNDLVMYYDTYNTQKSWRGAPTTNLHPIDGYITWPTQTIHFWNGNNWVVDNTYTDPGVSGPLGVYLGKVRKYTSGALSSSWSGNSYAYILKTAAMTGGQSYAMSAYTFLSGDCNIDAMYSSIEGASVAALSGGYVTAYDMAQKGSWQRQGLQGTASGNVNFIIAYPQRYGITNGSFTGFILVGGAQVEFGTFPTPYTDTSRSNTQAILDLTNNSTITAASLTYANNNTFSFNGSNYASVNAITGLSDFTVEIWFKSDSVANYRNPIDCNWLRYPGSYSNVGPRLEQEQSSGGKLNWIFGDMSGNYEYRDVVSSGLSSSVYHCTCLTKNGNIFTSYYNGSVVQSAAATYTWPGDFNDVNIGRGFSTSGERWFIGQIPSVKIYNGALSAAEVQQSFNAQRTRYGI